MPLDLATPPVAGISFRTVEPRDAEFLKALYRSVRDAELAATGWDEAKKRAFTDSQFALQDRWYRGRFPGALLVVIEERGSRIGRLSLCSLPGELRVMDIALVPERRGAGLGSALLRWIQAKAVEEARVITLHVDAASRARALYARLGFTEEGEEGFHVRMRWAPAPS